MDKFNVGKYVNFHIKRIPRNTDMHLQKLDRDRYDI